MTKHGCSAVNECSVTQCSECSAVQCKSLNAVSAVQCIAVNAVSTKNTGQWVQCSECSEWDSLFKCPLKTNKLTIVQVINREDRFPRYIVVYCLVCFVCHVLECFALLCFVLCVSLCVVS